MNQLRSAGIQVGNELPYKSCLIALKIKKLESSLVK